jgi:hypothetical protein
MTNAKASKSSSVTSQIVAASKVAKPVAKKVVAAKTTKPVTIAQAAKMLTEKAQRGDKIAAAKANVPSVKTLVAKAAKTAAPLTKKPVKATLAKKPAVVANVPSKAMLRREENLQKAILQLEEAVKDVKALTRKLSKTAPPVSQSTKAKAAWSAMMAAQKVFELVGA